MLRLKMMLKVLCKKKIKKVQIHMHQQLWMENKIDQQLETKEIMINLIVL